MIPRDIRVFVVDGIADIGAHVRSNLCYFIRLRHLIRSEQSHIGYFSRPIFLHALPSNTSTMKGYIRNFPGLYKMKAPLKALLSLIEGV